MHCNENTKRRSSQTRLIMRYKKILSQTESDKAELLKKEKSRTNRRRLLMCAVVFIVLFGIFEALIKIEFKPVYPIYLSALTILLAAFLLLNKGFANQLPTEEMLPETWNADEKKLFLEKLARDKARARVLLIFVIPLLFIFLIDFIILFFPELF